MKKILFMIILLILLAETRAVPVIENFSINPHQLWTDEAPTISLNCYDENHIITSVYSNIVGPYIILPTLNFAQVGINYIMDSSRIEPYLDRTGLFTVNVYCVNDVDETNSTSGTFTISEISIDVDSIDPDPMFIGDMVEVNLEVEKDGLPIKTYDVNFQIFFDDQFSDFTPTQPYYDERKGWVLRTDAPDDPGKYEFEILADYNGKEVIYDTQLNVEEPIQFKIVDVDNNEEIRPDDNITVKVRAFEKDNKIDLKKEYLTLKIGSVEIDSDNFYISSAGSIYDNIILKTPDLSPESYVLRIDFDYKDSSITETSKVFYVTPISGEILNYNDNPMDTEFSFTSSDMSKKIETGKNGSYYGFIILGYLFHNQHFHYLI